MTSPSGVEYTWETPYLAFAGNPENLAGLEHAAVHDATVVALQRWQRASEGAVDFDYWQGEYPTTMANDGLSTVFFASQMDPDDAAEVLSFSTVAYTRLWIEPGTGHILEADIVLNDVTFAFTTDREEAAYTDGWTNRTHHIEDVLVHELGHALGLDHSGVLQATQFTWGWPGQNSLSCDDRSGIRAAYPATRTTEDGQVVFSTVPTTGRISGAVRDPDDNPVLGAQVTLLSRDRQGVYAAGLSDVDGSWSIGGLEPGEYLAYVEPFYGGAQVLTGVYRDMNPIICPERTLFARQFVTEDDGVTLSSVKVDAGEELTIGAVRVECSADGGAMVPGSDPAIQEERAEVLLSGSGTTDRLEQLPPDGFRRWYRLEDIEGQLVVKLLSYSIYSPVWLSAELYTREGVELAADLQVPVMVDIDAGETVYDALLVAEGLPPGDYLLAVRSATLPTEEYPRGDLYVDTTPYAVMMLSAGQDLELAGLQDHSLSECWEPDYFTPYVSPPGHPPGYDPRGCGHAPGLGLWGLGLLGLTLTRRRHRQ
jgi:hypothetical protein